MPPPPVRTKLPEASAIVRAVVPLAPTNRPRPPVIPAELSFEAPVSVAPPPPPSRRPSDPSPPRIPVKSRPPPLDPTSQGEILLSQPPNRAPSPPASRSISLSPRKIPPPNRSSAIVVTAAAEDVSVVAPPPSHRPSRKGNPLDSIVAQLSSGVDRGRGSRPITPRSPDESDRHREHLQSSTSHQRAAKPSAPQILPSKSNVFATIEEEEFDHSDHRTTSSDRSPSVEPFPTQSVPVPPTATYSSKASTQFVDELSTKHSSHPVDEHVAFIQQPVPAAASSKHLTASALLVDDDDEGFFPVVHSALSPPPPSGKSALYAQGVGTVAAVAQTPQPLRSLLAAGNNDDEVPLQPLPLFSASDSHGGEPPLNTSPKTNDAADTSPGGPGTDKATKKRPQLQTINGRDVLVQPEMDFSTEPLDVIYAREEAAREAERVKGTRKLKVNLEKTIARLAAPKNKAAAKANATFTALPLDAPPVSSSPVGALSVFSLPFQQQPTAAASNDAIDLKPHSAGNASQALVSMERPNDTHCFFVIRCPGPHLYRIALSKKTPMISLMEHIGLANNGGMLLYKGNEVSPSATALSLGIGIGLQSCATLTFVSLTELEEEIDRRDIESEWMLEAANRGAFSEWVVRSSTQIAKHVFFDANDVFVDAC